MTKHLHIPSCSMIKVIIQLWSVLFVHVLCYRESSSVKINDLVVPVRVLEGTDVILECLYHTDGEELYTVRWFKGSNEFYRFNPKSRPEWQSFSVNGVKLDNSLTKHNRVVLKNVTSETSGNYRCEVLGDAPSFQLATEKKAMLVVRKPKSKPIISTPKSHYSVGEEVIANCSSSKSFPAANLTWFINGERVEDHHLTPYDAVQDENNLESSVLGLRFNIRHRHFREGVINLNCTATIDNIYKEGFYQALKHRNKSYSSANVIIKEFGVGNCLACFLSLWLFSNVIL